MIDTVNINLLHSGAILRLTKLVNMSEGQMREICVLVECTNCNEQLRERAIPISLSFVFISATSGK